MNKTSHIVRTIYFKPTNAPALTDQITELMIEVQNLSNVEREHRPTF